MSTTARASALAATFLICACDPQAFDRYAQTGDGGDELDAGRAEPSEASQPLLDAAWRDSSVTTPSDAESARPDAGDPGDAAVPDMCARATPQVVVSKPVVELARLAASAAFDYRVLGPTTRLGESDHVWTFSSTRLRAGAAAASGTPANQPLVAFDGAFQPWQSGPSGTAAWTLKEPVSTDAGLPSLLPLRSGEGAAVSLQPSSLLRRDPAPESLLFALQFDYLTASKVWLAKLPDRAAQATRPAKPLFEGPPLFALAARIDNDYLTVYACSQATPSRCVGARVLSTMAEQASAYQVRTMNAAGVWTWSDDLQAGVPLLDSVNGELSISYNSYLKKLLAVYSEQGGNSVVLRTASAAWGPWSEPVRVPLPAPSALNVSSVHEHPALAQNCERRLVISYFSPTRAAQGFATAGDTVLAAIDLD